MTAPYKKRAKKGWNGDKDQSNKDERAFIRQDIRELLTEEELSSLFEKIDDHVEMTCNPTKKKKKKALKAKDVANKIHSMERTLAFFKSRNVYTSNWIVGVIARYENELKDLNDLYIKLKEKK